MLSHFDIVPTCDGWYRTGLSLLRSVIACTKFRQHDLITIDWQRHSDAAQDYLSRSLANVSATNVIAVDEHRCRCIWILVGDWVSSWITSPLRHILTKCARCGEHLCCFYVNWCRSGSGAGAGWQVYTVVFMWTDAGLVVEPVLADRYTHLLALGKWYRYYTHSLALGKWYRYTHSLALGKWYRYTHLALGKWYLFINSFYCMSVCYVYYW